MDVEDAKSEYEKLLPIHQNNHFTSKLPMNKQSDSMKQVNYFTAMINILAEQAIRNKELVTGGEFFIDDPHKLVYFVDDNRSIIGSTSRRYDGAFPDTVNPLIVWEVKEYYYATTFGSRIADGVYETQLDGFEFEQLERETGMHVEHVFLVDSHYTWWVKGKSYLCRIIDALNRGLVDEVIFGREVLTRWPQLLNEVIAEKYEQE